MDRADILIGIDAGTSVIKAVAVASDEERDRIRRILDDLD